MQFDAEMLALIHTHIRTLWTLEVFLLMRKDSGRVWGEREIVLELRASNAAVREALAALSSAGLVHRVGTAKHAYADDTGSVHHAADRLAQLYEQRPLAVLKAIAASPDERVRIFADAFRLR